MATARIYDFAAEREHRARDTSALLSTFDPLECPRCNRLCHPSAVSADKVVLYECTGPGHSRDFAWRIDAHGDMMRGRRGKQYYP